MIINSDVAYMQHSVVMYVKGIVYLGNSAEQLDLLGDNEPPETPLGDIFH